jgi:hypothetical protein
MCAALIVFEKLSMFEFLADDRSLVDLDELKIADDVGSVFGNKGQRTHSVMIQI